MKDVFSKYWFPISAIVLVVGAAWIFISKAPPGTTSEGGIPAPRQGFMAPDFTLETSAGETITLSELRGKVVLLNFWATWCPPCRAEMPAFERAYQKYGDQGFVVVAVNVTYQDDREDAIAFADEFGLTFPILFDMDGAVSEKYQSNALPTSYFIDQDGIIQEVVVGGPMSEALLQIRIEQLLDQKQ